MKILLAGEYGWPWYQPACADALERLGCDVIRFSWLTRFKKWIEGKPEPVYRSFWHRLQFRLLDGPVVRRVNRDLIRTAVAERPDVIWFYNVQLIHAKTVRELRRRLPAATLCQYANDNPFSADAHASLWRHFLASVPFFDLHFAFRAENFDDYKARGARCVSLLRAYFLTETDHPLDPADIEPRFQCDVVFAGHYENDERVEMLEAICRAGYRLNLFGGGWNAALTSLAPDSPLRALYPIQPVTGRDYTQAICGAKVALSFLSTLNRDTYTRRSFQIPAMRTAMLSQRTPDLETLFTDGVDAAFFSTTEEMLHRLKELVTNAPLRNQIAAAGFDRVYRDGHDVTARMRQFLQVVTDFRRGASASRTKGMNG